MTCPRATTSILVPKALWAEEEKSTLKAASENTTLGGQKHEAQRTSRRPEGDVMSCPCRCDCHQEHTGAAAQQHVALSWLACVRFVHLCVAFGDRVLSGCVWAHAGGLLDLRKVHCAWEALSYPSFHSLAAFLLPVAPLYFGGRTMEVGGINFGNMHFFREYNYSEMALSVLNKAIKNQGVKHRLAHARWGGKPMEESHVTTTPTFYGSSGCSFHKSEKQFSFLPYFVGRTCGCAAVNEPCPIPTPRCSCGGASGSDRYGNAHWAAAGAPWAKEGCDEEGLCKPRHNKSLHPTGTNTHTGTVDAV